MSQQDTKLDTVLESIDESKRSTLNRLIVGGSFMAPLVASFAMGGLAMDTAWAQSNTTHTTASGK